MTDPPPIRHLFQGQACIHKYRNLKDCAKCCPQMRCPCGSGKHRRNCCFMTPTALRRKNEAAQRTKERKESMQQHLDEIQRIYGDKEPEDDKKAMESEQDAQNASGRCPCGYPNINDCLNCRIKQNVPSFTEQSTDTADTTNTTEETENVKTEFFTDKAENANNTPDKSTQQEENLDFDLPDHIFEVRGQIVQVPHLTQVYFLEPKSNYPPHLTTYEVRGCIVGVLHGTSVRFL